MTCVPGVTRGAREGQKETACIIGCVMCEQRRKSWVFTCSCTFMLSREVSTRQYLRSTDALGRSAAERTPRPAGPGQVRGSGVDSGARDGTEAHRPRAGVKVDETRSSEDGGERDETRRTIGGRHIRYGPAALPQTLTGVTAFGFAVVRSPAAAAGPPAPTSAARVTRMGGGGARRRVARAHLVTARPCPRRKPGHQRLSEVVS